MGKYASDSDSETHRNKFSHKYKSKRRSCSSESNSSKSRHKEDTKSSRRRRHQPRSRDLYSRYSSSHSYKSNSHKQSSSRESSRHLRSLSRDRRYRSDSKSRSRANRSRSRSYIREFISTKRSSSSSSCSSSLSGESYRNKTRPVDSSENTADGQADTSKAEILIMDNKVLDEINNDGFTQRAFLSNKSKVLDNIVIDLTKQTIKVPEVEPILPDSIFHHSLFLNEETRVEKWVKELYSYRQKALQQGNKNNV